MGPSATWGFIVVACAVLLAGCSDDADQMQRIERRLDQIAGEARQARSEIQRSNERLIEMLQQHGLQGGSLSSAPGQLSKPEGLALNMEASKKLVEANATMTAAMAAVPLTGDPDRDFLAQMIPHHQGAIDMSRVLLKDGLRPEVRRFAQEIIAHQQGEIELMNRWLTALGK